VTAEQLMNGLIEEDDWAIKRFDDFTNHSKSLRSLSQAGFHFIHQRQHMPSFSRRKAHFVDVSCKSKVFIIEMPVNNGGRNEMCGLKDDFSGLPSCPVGS